MRQGAHINTNMGMQRDISVSKTGNTFAFENLNIRVTARDHDTFLSVTNERGNKEISLLGEQTISGTLIGWNTLNNYLVLFTTDSSVENPDKIYRIEYKQDEDTFNNTLLFQGYLGFSVKSPIESVTYYESDDILKIYWIDGIHVLRFMNICNSYLTSNSGDSTKETDIFDTNRYPISGLSVTITKNNSGQTRANGTVQYFAVYYNKNGQQTGYVWVSDLVYLSPMNRGGGADENNTNQIVFSISDYDNSFDYLRLYALVRSSYNGTPNAYIVGEVSIPDNYTKKITLVDNGNVLEEVDYTEILYLGSKSVIAGTMTHKDQTLFLGDLKSVGKTDVADMSDIIKEYAFGKQEDGECVHADFVEGEIWESNIVRFRLTDNIFQETESGVKVEDCDIPYVAAQGLYPYENQLQYSQSQISTFKGGEKYRFALKFYKNGVATDAYWIGDKINPYYPVIDRETQTIHRPIAECDFSGTKIIEKAKEYGFDSVVLMIAEAGYSDRSVMAQGVVNPTVFNTLFRYNNSPFLQSSWLFRPRNSSISNKHYEVLKKSNTVQGELQCNYWENTSPTPTPYYYLNSSGEFINTPDGYNSFSRYKIAYSVGCSERIMFSCYWGTIRIVRYFGSSAPDSSQDGTTQINNVITITDYYFDGSRTGYPSVMRLYNYFRNCLKKELIPTSAWPTESNVYDMCQCAQNGATFFKYSVMNFDMSYTRIDDTLDNIISGESWCSVYTIGSSLLKSYSFSQYTRHLFFVDEHAVTLNSPEIEYEAVDIDNNSGINFRIVGAIRLTSNISDYTLDYSNGYKSGEQLLQESFSHLNISNDTTGLIAYPLFIENGLTVLPESELTEKGLALPSARYDDDLYDYTSDYYKWASGQDTYMLYMFGRSGSIPGYIDSDGVKWSTIDNKIIANQRYAYLTAYNNYTKDSNGKYGNDFWNALNGDGCSSIRQFTSVDKQYMNVVYDDATVIYSGSEDEVVSMPANLRYPIFKTTGSLSQDDELSLNYYMRSEEPINVSYLSKAHAIINLGDYASKQIILPRFSFEDEYQIQQSESTSYSGPYLAWKDNNVINGYSVAWIYRENGEFVPYDADVTVNDDGTVSFTFEGYSTVKDDLQDIINSNGTNGVYTLIKDKTTSTIYIVNVTAIDKQDGITPYISVNTEIDFENDTAGSDPDVVIATTNVSYNVTPNTTMNIKWQRRDKEILTSEVWDDFEVNDDGTFQTYVTETYYEYRAIVYGDIEKTTQGKFTYAAGYLEAISLPIVYDEGTTGIVYAATDEVSFTVKSISISNANCVIVGESTQQIKLQDFNTGKLLSVSALTGEIEEVAAQSQSVTNIFDVKQDVFELNRDADKDFIGSDDEFLFIGELYYDYDNNDISLDTRYGGISESAVELNTFIEASSRHKLTDDDSDDSLVIIGNMGDTYFQRWDCLKTVPYGEKPVNGVIESLSMMVESHINLDGRTDLSRGINKLASVNTEELNLLNTVYSQPNNFIQSYDTDVIADNDSYRTTITWTKSKHDSEDIDQWTHITLSSTLKLNGDNGPVRALRTFNNSIIAFQDSAINHVLFNERTVLSSDSSTPVEIANSGKVTGSQIISDKYGCRNKWSIVEGKLGLYFVDDSVKSICQFNGQTINNLSLQTNIDTFIKRRLSESKDVSESWFPDECNNIVSFYDTRHSDVYFNLWNAEDKPCLVFSENLGNFIGVFDYYDIPMMVNLQDRFLSFKDGILWLQNEGFYCNFFGTDYPYYVDYFVLPDAYSDKIWTNVEYRADFYEVLDDNGNDIISDDIIDGGIYLSDGYGTGIYRSDETFDKLNVWNEYQQTPELNPKSVVKTNPLTSGGAETYPDTRKTFRIWRMDIPRAIKTASNKYGLDRIRNPWIRLKLTRNASENNRRLLMQLHDIIIKFYTNDNQYGQIIKD